MICRDSAPGESRDLGRPHRRLTCRSLLRPQGRGRPRRRCSTTDLTVALRPRETRRTAHDRPPRGSARRPPRQRRSWRRLPWLARFPTGKTIVLKYGGHAMADPGAARRLRPKTSSSLRYAGLRVGDRAWPAGPQITTQPRIRLGVQDGSFRGRACAVTTPRDHGPSSGWVLGGSGPIAMSWGLINAHGPFRGGGCPAEDAHLLHGPKRRGALVDGETGSTSARSVTSLRCVPATVTAPAGMPGHIPVVAGVGAPVPVGEGRRSRDGLQRQCRHGQPPPMATCRGGRKARHPDPMSRGWYAKLGPDTDEVISEVTRR